VCVEVLHQHHALFLLLVTLFLNSLLELTPSHPHHPSSLTPTSPNTASTVNMLAFAPYNCRQLQRCSGPSDAAQQMKLLFHWRSVGNAPLDGGSLPAWLLTRVRVGFRFVGCCCLVCMRADDRALVLHRVLIKSSSRA
jgi:hypothetical protein